MTAFGGSTTSSVDLGSVGSRLASTATVPIPVAQRTHEATIYREDPALYAAATQVTVVAPSAPQSRTEEMEYNGAHVIQTETREALQPMISHPQLTSMPAVVREEKLPATVSTRAYEVFRRDPASLFPGAKIIGVGNCGPVTTPTGSIYDPSTNTITSAFNGQTTHVQLAHHVGPSAGLNVGGGYPNSNVTAYTTGYMSGYVGNPSSTSSNYGGDSYFAGVAPSNNYSASRTYTATAGPVTTYPTAFSYGSYSQQQQPRATSATTTTVSQNYGGESENGGAQQITTYYPSPQGYESSYPQSTNGNPVTPPTKVSFQNTPLTRYTATPGTYVRQPSWTSSA